jgi:hypothetical protein
LNHAVSPIILQNHPNLIITRKLKKSRITGKKKSPNSSGVGAFLVLAKLAYPPAG